MAKKWSLGLKGLMPCFAKAVPLLTSSSDHLRLYKLQARPGQSSTRTLYHHGKIPDVSIFTGLCLLL